MIVGVKSFVLFLFLFLELSNPDKQNAFYALQVVYLFCCSFSRLFKWFEMTYLQHMFTLFLMRESNKHSYLSSFYYYYFPLCFFNISSDGWMNGMPFRFLGQ